MSLRAVMLIALPVVLSGCATLQRTGTDWDARRTSLLQDDVWSLRGRVAVRTSAGDGGQAALNWQQTGQQSTLQLAGPFGAGRVELSVAPEVVSLRTAAGESVSYEGPAAAQRFMNEQLGWSFPVDSARFWMRGLLDPGAPGERLYDAGGELTGLRQHGWDISLNRFAAADGQLLPTRLTMESPQLRLKAVVSNWTRDALN